MNTVIRFFLFTLFSLASILSFGQTFSPDNIDIELTPDNFTSQKRVVTDVDALSKKRVFVWQELDGDGTSNRNIWCAIYDESMTQLFKFKVNKTTTGDQIYPTVKINQEDNSFLVAWSSWINNTNPSDPNNYDIYAKKIKFSDVLSDAQASDLFINYDSWTNSTPTNGRQILPLIAFDYKRKEALVAWVDQDGQDRLPTVVTGVDYGSYARRINYYPDNYIPYPPQFRINGVTTSHQTINAIEISQETGELYTICQSVNYIDANYDIVFRKFTRNSSGDFVGGTESVINTYTTNHQVSPAIAINSKNGNYAISWTDYVQDGSGYGIYMKVYDKNGTLLKSETRVNQNAYANQLYSKCVWEESTYSLIFFYWYSESSAINVRYQIFDKSYNYSGSEGLAETKNLQNYYAGLYSVAYEKLSRRLILAYEEFQSSSGSNSKAWATQLSMTLPETYYNYARTQIILKDNVTNESLIDALPAEEMSQTTKYFDGLGKTTQTIIKQGSPLKKDIVKLNEYNEFGEEEKKFLPFVSSLNTGQFLNSYKAAQVNFYTTNTDPLIGKTGSTNKVTYAQTVSEPSPLGTPIEQSMPGDAWGLGAGHTVKNATTFDNPGSFLKWKYDAATGNASCYQLVSGVPSYYYYITGEIITSKLTDENGNKVITYTDRQGLLVSRKIQNGANSNEYLETRYVYDGLGQLRYVIPPQISSDKINFTYNDAYTKKWIFCYKYDSRKRLIEKRVPSSEPLYIFYDILDRVVLTQDGVQRATPNKYSFVKYDVLSRIIQTGLCTISGTAQSIRSAISSAIILNEKRTCGSMEGYTNVAYPIVTSSDILSVNYYDDYDFDFCGGSADVSYRNAGYPVGEEPVPSSLTRGMATGTKSKILGSSNYLINAVFYDKKGRSIQCLGNNALNLSIQDVTTNVYSFSGVVLKSKTIHTPGNSLPVITVNKRYEYDHVGRLNNVYQQNNTFTEVQVANYKYNELGQNIEKNLHKDAGASSFLQSIDYRYNIRGWLTSINNSTLTNNGTTNDDTNDLFGMNLSYESNITGTTGQYNGNVSAQQWKTNNSYTTSTEKAYGYTYDYASRLTKAGFSENNGSTWTANTRYDECITLYDNNGNIKSAYRKDNNAAAYIDNLTYTYDGNKLLKVDDASNNASGFKDTPGNDYTYDVNGNTLSDLNKGITTTYNHLNLPVEITFTGSGKKITYTYNAFGQKLKRTITEGAVLTTTDYVNGFIYSNNSSVNRLSYFPTEEGRVIPAFTGSSITGFVFEYHITDHLGNVRISFDKHPTTGTARVIQENHYYAFGGIMEGTNILYEFSGNKNLYTGQELQSELGLNLYDYNARQYDPYLGRFTSIDPHADSYSDYSPYAYVLNNPCNFTDPTGRDPVYDWNTGQYTDNGRTVSFAEVRSWLYGQGRNGAESMEMSRVNDFIDLMNRLDGQDYSISFNGGGDDEIVRVSTNDGVHIFYSTVSFHDFSDWQAERQAYWGGKDFPASPGMENSSSGVQTVLEVAGLVPGIGEVADGVNALIYLADGDYTNASLSAASMIPIAGWAAAGAKAGKKAIWSSSKKLSSVENAFGHFKKHGAEFPEFYNAKEYVEGAKSFLHSSPTGTLMKTRANGDILKYNPATNIFGVMDGSGVPRTMFKPTDGINYWLQQ